MAKELRPEIALLDIGLPVQDGYEVARQLRAGAFQPDLRLVAITGYGAATDRERSRDAGFVAHLTKPLDLTRVRALLTELSTEDRSPTTSQDAPVASHVNDHGRIRGGGEPAFMLRRSGPPHRSGLRDRMASKARIDKFESVGHFRQRRGKNDHALAIGTVIRESIEAARAAS